MARASPPCRRSAPITSRGLHVMLSVPIVDTVATLLPSDLAAQGAKLDSPAVIARAEAMVTEVVSHSGSELAYFVLSNEVDINVADGEPTWAQVETLIAAL